MHRRRNEGVVVSRPGLAMNEETKFWVLHASRSSAFFCKWLYVNILCMLFTWKSPHNHYLILPKQLQTAGDWEGEQ